MRFGIYLESGPQHRKTWVCVPSLPGCSTMGPTTDEAGREHVLIPFAMVIRAGAPASFWTSTGHSPADYSSLDWGGLVGNLGPVTLGNIVGGAIFVGAVYLRVYLREKDGLASAPPKLSFRDPIVASRPFVTLAEVVPWRATRDFETGRRSLAAAPDLVGDPRITAISITDNAGGHAVLSPQALAGSFELAGAEPVAWS